MPIHKLANGPITLTIASCEVVSSNFGDQHKFSDGQTDVYINVSTSVRQLARLNLSKETVIGQTLHFAQVKKDGKTFTDITVVGAGQTPPAARPASSGTTYTPAAPKLSLEELEALYGQCVQAAIRQFVRACDEVNIPYDGQAVAAAAATLFIAAKDGR